MKRLLPALVTLGLALSAQALSPCPDSPPPDDLGGCQSRCYNRLQHCIVQVSNQVGGDLTVCVNRYDLCMEGCWGEYYLCE